MDNFRINIVSETRKSFDLAMQLVFAGKWRDRKASHYIIDSADYKYGSETIKIPRFVLFSSDYNKDAIKLPIILNAQAASDMIWNWLEQVDYPPDPTHDGSNGKGFRIYNDFWGQVEPHGYPSFIAVTPEWAWYGK